VTLLANLAMGLQTHNAGHALYVFNCLTLQNDLASTPVGAPAGYIYSTTSCNRCGDNIIKYRFPTVEECDDANLIDGDGCSSVCKIESGWTCTPTLVNVDIVGPSICTKIPSCNTGTNGQYSGPPPKNMIYLFKPCDDGNTDNNDGCNRLCLVESGWLCTGGTAATFDLCSEICGEGRNYHSYANECDDGNTIDGDGCSSTCTVETGWTCTGGNMARPDVCVIDATTCAVTIDFGYKSCADGNGADADG
jgi:cysteine-rich repeat protein